MNIRISQDVAPPFDQPSYEHEDGLLNPAQLLTLHKT